jgi:hypothetical protein
VSLLGNVIGALGGSKLGSSDMCNGTVKPRVVRVAGGPDVVDAPLAHPLTE